MTGFEIINHLRLMCHSYLQHPLHVNGLIHRMLNIYSHCEVVALLTWKTDYFLALVRAKCSGFILFYIANHWLFLSIMLLFLFLHVVARWMDQIIYHILYIMNHNPVLTFCPLSYLNAYLCCTESFMKKLERSCKVFVLW